MILNFTLFNRITTSIVYILLWCIWYVRFSSLSNHFGIVWSVAYVSACKLIYTISCRLGFSFVVNAIRIQISLITNESIRTLCLMAECYGETAASLLCCWFFFFFLIEMMDLFEAPLTFLLVKLKRHEVHRLSPVCHIVTHHVILNSNRSTLCTLFFLLQTWKIGWNFTCL